MNEKSTGQDNTFLTDSGGERLVKGGDLMRMSSTRYAAFAIDGDGQLRMTVVGKEGMSKQDVEDTAWMKITWDVKDLGWDEEPRLASLQVVDWETAMHQEPYRTALITSDDYARLVAISGGEGVAAEDGK